MRPTGAPPGGLLVVAVDRLPAWILPAYGSTWVAMPALDGLAARGVVLDRVIATTDDPGATLADLLCHAAGQSPLVAAAAAHGLSSALITDDASLTLPGAGVTRVTAAATSVPEHEPETTCLARLCAAAREVMTGGGHGLVVVHATSLGTCWDAPQEFRAAYVDPDDPPPPPGANVPDFDVAGDADPDLLVGVRQAFAGQLTLLDRCLGPVLAAAAAANWTVLVAGLRGLALGLHGRVGPGTASAHGELLHVPAILVDAAGRMAGQRYGGLVVPADLGATLVDLLDAAAPSVPATPWAGRSLTGLLASWAGPRRDRAVAVVGGGAALVTPAWHCATDGARARLFAKPDDYFDLCDVADRCPEVAAELGRLAARAAAGDVEAAWREPLSDAALEGFG